MPRRSLTPKELTVLAIAGFVISGICALAWFAQIMGDRNPSAPPLTAMERNQPWLFLFGGFASFAVAMQLMKASKRSRRG